MWEAAWGTFSPPPTSPSPPRDIAGRFAVALLMLCCALLYMWCHQVIQAHQNPGDTWNTKAILYMHEFSLCCPRRCLQLFFMAVTAPLKVWALPLQGFTLGYCNTLSCGLAENHLHAFVCFQNAANEYSFLTILLWPHSTSMLFFTFFFFVCVVTSTSHIQNKHCAFSWKVLFMT